MEVEAWFLAMKDIFLNLDSRLTVEYIKQHTTIDLNVLNPETAFFHPTQVLKQIYALAGGKEYDKSKGDISALASFIGKQDIENLLASSDSFKSFYYALPLP
jgi:ornithine carbamoyltransferase